jgi:hypothetical protein
MVSPGGADKEVAVIGSHNKAHFQALLKNVEGENPKAHMVICQQQFDEGDQGKLVDETLTTRTSSTLDAKVSIFKPALSGNLVVSGCWKSLAPAGHPDHGKTGKLTDADIIIEKNRNSRSEFKVKLPAAAPEPSASNKVKVEIVFQGVAGPFLGESDGKQILAVYDPSDPIDFQNTLTHEMGHAYNQTPGPGDQSPGLEAHPHYYVEHGGIGPHCSTILKDGKEAKGLEVDGEDDEGNKIKVYATGVCVMFHSGPQPGCLNRYCDICTPFIKATDFSGFGKA